MSDLHPPMTGPTIPDEETPDEMLLAKLTTDQAVEAADYFAARRARIASENAPAEKPAGDVAKQGDQSVQSDQESAITAGDLVRGVPRAETFTESILRNISPIAAAGGFLQGMIAEPIRMGHDIDQAMGLPRVVVGGEDGPVSLQWPGEPDPKVTADELVPDFGDEGLAKGVGQFLGGFYGASKLLKPLGVVQEVAKSGKVGASAVSALKGAMADFASFDGMSNPVNALVSAFPSLEGPVTEFLDSDEEDPKVIQRLKNSLVGVIPGVAIDTVVGGLRGIRGWMKAEPTIEAVDATIKQAESVMGAQKARLGELLGNVDDANLVTPAAADDVAEAASKPEAGFVGKAGEDITGPRPNASNRVGNVFVNWARVDSEDDVKNILGEMANRHSDSIDAARGGAYESHAQVRLDAREVDALKIVEERRASNRYAVPLPAAEMTAVRDLWVGSGRKLRELMRAVNSNPGPMEKMAFRKQLDTHAMIQNVFIGARTATARAQSAMRIPAGDVADWTIGIEGEIARLDMGRTTEQIAAGLAALDSMGRGEAAESFVDFAAKWADNGADMVKQCWYFSLLSGFKTHMRNALSNTAMLGANVASRKGANLIGQVLGEENVVSGEAAAKFFGDLEGMRAAFRVNAELRAAQNIPETAGLLRKFWASAKSTPVGQAFIEGKPGMGLGKPEAKMVGAFDPSKLGVDPDSVMGYGLRAMDAITSSSSRGLMAADEVFKSANFHGELNALALRQAIKEVDSGMLAQEAVPDRVAELVTSHGLAMKMASIREAGWATFTNEPLDTPIWRAAKAVHNMGAPGRIAAPFLRTPYNVFIESFQWNPVLAPITRRFREEIAAGGARADIAMSKLALGGMMLVEMSRWAMDGYLRGEGGELNTDPAKRQTMARNGDLPMTITVPTPGGGKRTFNFRGLEPFSTHMGFAANLVDLMNSDEFGDEDRDLDDLVIASAASIGSSILNASLVQGFSDMSSLLSDPMRHSEQYAENLFGTLIPAIARDIGQAIDPTVRDVNNLFDAARARIPILASGLPAKIDAWGRDITRESGLGKVFDALSPFYSNEVDPEPVDEFLKENEIWIGSPQKDVSFGGITINMRNKPELYRDFVKMQGQKVTSRANGDRIETSFGYKSDGGNLLEELNSIVSGTHSFSPIFEMGTPGPDGDQADFIKGIVGAFRNEAKRQLVKEHPELEIEIRSRADEMPDKRFKRVRPNEFLSE